MDIQFWQILLILVYMAFFTYEGMNIQVMLFAGIPMLGGVAAGLIFGNLKIGLEIGATLQLMSLGIGAYGGASVPDYHTGAVVGTIIAIVTQKDLSYGLAIALPVSLLMIQLDVLTRISTTFFLHKGHTEALKNNVNGAYNWIRMGSIPWVLKGILPVLLVFIVGADNINSLLELLPDWIMGGFKVAGGILPAVGIGILLKYMNAKNYVAYLIIGFAAVAYLSMPMLGVALFGVALALITFANNQSKTIEVSVGGKDDDEI